MSDLGISYPEGPGFCAAMITNKAKLTSAPMKGQVDQGAVVPKKDPAWA
jgi:hypothetical protein